MLFLFGCIYISLKSNESNNIYFSANVSNFCITDLVLGNLFCARYQYKSLKYGLIKFSACISFMVTFLCIIFNILSISAHFNKTFCTNLAFLLHYVNLVVHGNMTCLAFHIFLISHLLHVGNLLKIHVNLLFQ